MISRHPRMLSMTSMIMGRRGMKNEITVPIYSDKFTGEGKVDGAITPGKIHMDSMQFGAGCCCLQITFEAQNLNHATYLHDSFIPLGPIFGALSANTPIYKGQLANTDFRWNVLSAAFDCRTDSEKDKKNTEKFVRSRYSAMSRYISDHPFFKDEKLDDGVKYKINKDFFRRLKDTGMSDRLAYHITSLFFYDSLTIYEDHLNYTPDSTEHFENFNSTNWNSVRFKPPPSLDSEIGWRVEFRTLDVQITDYENAAFVTLLNLVTKILNDFDVNLSLPISLCEINMERAHEIDAVTNQKFWFRRNILPTSDIKSQDTDAEDNQNGSAGPDYTENKFKANNWRFDEIPEKYSEIPDSPQHEFVEMTIADILEGNKEIGNTGLVELFLRYMEEHKFTPDVKEFY